MAKTGGVRVGAGRKPRMAPVVAFNGADVPVPAGLTDAQRGKWEAWAPLAQKAQTLTAQTVPGFRLMCEQGAALDAYTRQIEADGLTFEKVTVDGAGQEQRELKAHPLIGKAQITAARLEQLMARFMIAPNGRPMQHAETKESRWAKFGIAAS